MGFTLPKTGTLVSIIVLISGPIIPDRKDKNNVRAMEIKVFTLTDFLLETPINTPKETPNKFPNIIKILLYFISLNNSIFKTYFIKIRSSPLDSRFNANATMIPANRKLCFFSGVTLILAPILDKLAWMKLTVSIPVKTP